jgi:hypothetical protein
MLTEGDLLMNERLNSLLNNSCTKQAYSFGKALRFKIVDKKDNFFHFYDIPEKKSTRSTTLGYGKKCNYSQIIGCGSNKLMAAPSYFDPQKHNAPVYSFGVSRPKKRKQDESPGPIYNITKKFGEGIPSYIFGTSGLRNKKLVRSSSLPGPGEYYNERNHGLSVSSSSSLINSANIVIGKEKRFMNEKKDRTPGPGQYNVPGLINNTGMINYNSKYVSIPAKSFLGKRNEYSIRKQDSSPGPGSYNFFSIFEGYSKEKRQKPNNN